MYIGIVILLGLVVFILIVIVSFMEIIYYLYLNNLSILIVIVETKFHVVVIY